MQTAVIWSCFPFIRSGQNYLARHSERGKKTRPTKKEVGRQHQGMDRPGARQVPEGSGEQGNMEKTGCKVICGAPTTLAVKGLMMMMMMMIRLSTRAHLHVVGMLRFMCLTRTNRAFPLLLKKKKKRFMCLFLSSWLFHLHFIP